MLDDLLPHPDFVERHRRRVPASPARTWEALTTVTLADLTVTRPLLALRHLTAPRRPTGPLLTDGPVTLLTRDDDRGCAVGGAVAQPWRPGAPHRAVDSLAAFTAFDEPGWTKYLTEFRVEPDGGRGAVLTTETRGVSTDAAARRRFRLYWWLIRIPSGIIRRDILRTVARAAARPGQPGQPGQLGQLGQPAATRAAAGAKPSQV